MQIPGILEFGGFPGPLEMPSGDKKKGFPRNFFVLKSSAFGRLDYDTEAS
jgi:hypothetical protein